METSDSPAGDTMFAPHIPLLHGKSPGVQHYNPVLRPWRPCSLSLSCLTTQVHEQCHHPLISELQVNKNQDQAHETKVDNLCRYCKETVMELSHNLNCTHDKALWDAKKPWSLYEDEGSPQTYFEGPNYTALRNTKMCHECSRRLKILKESHEKPESQNYTSDQVHETKVDNDCKETFLELSHNLNYTHDKTLWDAKKPMSLYQDEGNLQKYFKGTIYTALRNAMRCQECSRLLKILNQNMDLSKTSKGCEEITTLLDSGMQFCRASKSTPTLMDCDERDWGEKESREKPESQNYASDCETFTQNQIDSISDSSCNSSDGVLVNFSAIYNKTNNAVPATPEDSDSPARQSQESRSTSQKDLPQSCSPLCRFDSNRNIYQTDDDGSSVSDLDVCLQSRIRRLTPQSNYYKLVTCDLSPQSPMSPEWSPITSSSEPHSQKSWTPHEEYVFFKEPKEEQEQVEKRETSNLQVCSPKMASDMQNISQTIENPKQPGLNSSINQKSMEVENQVKVQRPTFLPIQPFVLQPPSRNQSSTALVSLLDQYMSLRQKKSNELSSHVEPSPSGSFSSINLQVASSSDSCSTCTPTPVQPLLWPHWSRFNPQLYQTHPERDQSLKDLDEQQAPPAPNQAWTFSEERLQELFRELTCSIQTPERRTQKNFSLYHCMSCSVVKSATSLTLNTSISQPGTERRHQCSLDAPQQAMTNKEPKPIAEFHSFHDLLKAVSSAVDMITDHFNYGKDPQEKIRLGSSSLSPGVSELVLDQLCPALRTLLQDGLRSFKPDLIVGRRRIKPWSVVEASTQPETSTRVLYSLVSVVGKCSELSSHSMRLNAFILGLLNLSALEFWLHHLHTCADVIGEFYHPHAFLSRSHGSCNPLFRDLLDLLQPLSQLPFDLHLLSESRLQSRLKHNQPSIQHLRPRSLSGCHFLPTPRPGGSKTPKLEKKSPNKSQKNVSQNIRGCAIGLSSCCDDEQRSVSVGPSEKKHAGWWLNQNPVSEDVVVCSGVKNNHILTQNEEDEPPKDLRWTRLFGSGIKTATIVKSAGESTVQTQRTRPPSQWLKLGASKLDQLVQTVWRREISRTV